MSNRIAKAVVSLIVVVLFVGSALSAPTLINERLIPVLDAADANDMIRVMAIMEDQHDVDRIAAMAEGFRGDDRKALVWNEVQNHANAVQADLLQVLYALEQEGTVREITSLKLANSVEFYATPEVIHGLASRTDLLSIEYSDKQKVIPDLPELQEEIGGELDEIVWGVNNVNAPDVWNMGYTGQGVLLAIIDTGVNYNHNDLNDHLWNGGGSYPNHGYDFESNDNNPMDGHGHGTHCAGTALGDGTAGSQTGVAPDATLMCLKVLDNGGYGSRGDVWDAMDFCIAQNVDVTSISLGWMGDTVNNKRIWRQTFDLANAAGIVNIVAAHNYGDQQYWYPAPDNVTNPGNCPPPWLHPDNTEVGSVGGVITVGATNSSNNIASFSSRGPVAWDNVSPFYDFPYTPGDGLLKPDVSAPGVDVKSCNYQNVNGYLSGWSGTSMATPNVAGTAALLLERYPNLTPAEICEALELTSLDRGATGKDNAYGTGKIDAFDAINYTFGGGGNDLDITLFPDGIPPLYVAANGGYFYFDATIYNNYNVNTPGVIWIEAIMPNGNLYPVAQYDVTYRPGFYISATNVSQWVPANAPAGSYQFVAKAGLSYGNPIDSDQFEFIKLGVAAGGVDAWTSNGFDLMAQTAESFDTYAPSDFGLGQAYPNPFNPTTSISLTLPSSGFVTVAVFNALGQEVAQLQNGQLTAGQHSFVFDASDMSSGVYFVHAEAGAETSMQKVVLMK
jgi:subtilisin family serine protease